MAQHDHARGHGQPYPRIVVLHVAVLLAFGLRVAGSFSGLPHLCLLTVLILITTVVRRGYRFTGVRIDVPA